MAEDDDGGGSLPRGPWLTVEAAARLLGVSSSTIRRLIEDGLLPAYRVSVRATRLLADDVRRYLAACRWKH